VDRGQGPVLWGGVVFRCYGKSPEILNITLNHYKYGEMEQNVNNYRN